MIQRDPITQVTPGGVTGPQHVVGRPVTNLIADPECPRTASNETANLSNMREGLIIMWQRFGNLLHTSRLGLGHA